MKRCYNTRAKIAVSEAEYAVMDSRKKVRKQILQSEIDCQAASDKYRHAQEELAYTEEAWRQIDEKYGLNTTDYLTWQTAMVELVNARYSLAEAKYAFILKKEVLKVYVNGY